MILHESGSETGRQGFGKHATAGCLVLEFNGDRIGNLGQQRVTKAAVITQRSDQRWIDLDTEDSRREPLRRKKDMQDVPHWIGNVEDAPVHAGWREPDRPSFGDRTVHAATAAPRDHRAVAVDVDADLGVRLRVVPGDHALAMAAKFCGQA